VPGVSVTIITRNESANIDACLAAVAWADDVLVVDSHSTDDTVERAKSRGARVILRDWPGSYADQKNFAAAQSRHDWILSVDADERVTPALAAEVRAVVASGADIAGYRLPRVTWHLGRWIRTTDWYPDYQLRLYDRRRATWPPRLVHESVRVNGPIAYLKSDLEHYAYRDITHHHEVMNHYTTLAAQQMREQGRRAGLLHVVIHPAAAFLRNYVLKRGFMDGMPGFIISVMNAQYVFLKFAKLWELQRRSAD
jgi:glycosyltransferase involved in cell wall biosynthesis